MDAVRASYSRRRWGARQVYTQQVLDHFENPRNAGLVAEPDATAQTENPACGDTLKLSARIRNGRIEEIRFQARGCVASIACASALTELLDGRAVEDARRLSREQIVAAIGGLPAASTHASHLAIDALRALLEQVDRGR